MTVPLDPCETLVTWGRPRTSVLWSDHMEIEEVYTVRFRWFLYFLTRYVRGLKMTIIKHNIQEKHVHNDMIHDEHRQFAREQLISTCKWGPVRRHLEDKASLSV